MILSFKIKNFKSIRDEQVLDLTPEKKNKNHEDHIVSINSKISALRSTVIFGANASGKSTIIDALETFQVFVSLSHRNSLDEKIEEYKPFKLAPETIYAPTVFSLEFIGNGNIPYLYSVEYNETKVLKESLKYCPQKQFVKLFERKDDLPISKWAGDNLDGIKYVSCLENQLYLSVLANHVEGSEKIKNVYRYIGRKIDILSPTALYSRSHLLKKKERKEALTKLLSCADTGISCIDLRETILNENDLKKLSNEKIPELFRNLFINESQNRPVFFHNNTDIEFTEDEESAGTRRLYELAVPLLIGLPQGIVLVIDEMDCKLHPKLVEMILRLFNDPSISKKNAQLIFTAHSTYLLNNDLMRRDQIYFTQKNSKGVTSLYSLDEFKEVRGNTNFEKWYHDGRFDAIPDINYYDLGDLLASAEKYIEG